MTVDKDLKENEMESVEELRMRMKSVMEEELYDDTNLLLRFLKAREFSIDNTEIMLKKHLQWREKYDVKNALKWKNSEFSEKYLPNHFIGFDKEGCVVRFCPVGTIDFAGYISSVKPEDIAKFLIHENEQDSFELKEQSKKLGRNVDKCVYIYDLENMSFAQCTDKKVIYYFIFLLNLYINNYPERLKVGYIINVPVFFNILYSIMKSLLPVTILNKVHIYSNDSYKKDLVQVIDPDILPAFLGGNKTDPDGNPLCLKVVKRGERVPDSYYLSKNRQPLAKSPGVKKITLARAAFHEVNLDVKEAGSFLEWEFETKCRDIGFGLFYQETVDGKEKITELVSIQRIDTDLYPETGTFRCDVPGTYVILFDNTYSWVRSKDIYYRIKLVSPKEHELSQIKE